MSTEDRAARLARRLVGAGGDEPEQHREERAEPEHQADDQQDEHLRVGAEVRDDGVAVRRNPAAPGARIGSCAPGVRHAVVPVARTVKINRRRPTLPGPCGPSTIGAEGLNGSVRNGKRCFPLAIATGNLRDPPIVPVMCHRSLDASRPAHTDRPRDRRSRALKTTQCQCTDIKYPSSPRPISTSLLRTSPPFQIWPINLVIFQGSYSLEGMGELISRPASHLDAFSGYPIRT